MTGPRSDSPEGQALEEVLRRFEQAWKAGPASSPRIEDFLTDGELDRHILLIELVHTDLEYRLKAGEEASVGEYLERFPSLGDSTEDLIELVAAEFHHRAQRGHEPAVEDYVRRFP